MTKKEKYIEVSNIIEILFLAATNSRNLANSITLKDEKIEFIYFSNLASHLTMEMMALTDILRHLDAENGDGE